MLRLANSNYNSIIHIFNTLSSFNYILHHYSSSAIVKPKKISSSLPSVTKFLVNSLDLSEHEALSVSTKLNIWRCRNPKGSSLTSLKSPNSILTFLGQIGLDQSQIRELVCCAPQILTVKVATLKPKIKALQVLGLYGSHLVKVISSNPVFLRRGLVSVILPVIQALKQALGSDFNVISILSKRSTWIFSYFYIKNLVPNVVLLEKYGIPKDKIQKHVLQHPRAFMVKKELFEKTLIVVEEKWGIRREARMFLYCVQLVVCQSEEVLESKCRMFKSYGWSDNDIMMIVRKNPYCLALSEARTKESWDFLMKELGYDPKYLAPRPAFLTYSLANRLLPRYKILVILKEKGLLNNRIPLYTAATMTEAKFFERFIQPYKDVHDVYAECCKVLVQQRSQEKPDSNV